MTHNIGPTNHREKELKLLHLDHIQREVLEPITAKFLSGSKITISEVVEAFTKYVLKLAELSASGDKLFNDHSHPINVAAQKYLAKFTAAILICTKHQIHYNKIFASKDLQYSFSQAGEPRNKMTNHHMNELGYKIKVTAYSMLESDNSKMTDYIDNMKEFYFRSLATVNPPVAKRSFIDQIVSMLSHYSHNTISDISNLVNKYALYLGNAKVDHNRIEELVHKYSDLSIKKHEGLLHAAKIEVFKILEGI